MKRAFTMIELMVVVGIIGILMAVLLGTFSGSTESARAAKCESNMHNLAMAVQSVGMSSGYYPRARFCEYEDENNETKIMHGWLGDLSNPYETSSETRRTCFDNGAIWPVLKRDAEGNATMWKIDRSSCVCPSHEKYAKEHSKVAPLWSYAMNSYFNAGANASKQRRYGSLRRADRFLLLAELPFAKMTVGTVDIQSGNASGDELDAVLDRENESIGFNHKDGSKNVIAHVCFADGHVEKFRAPKDKGNIKQLTQWLCRPVEVSNNGDVKNDFDIRFNGTTYEKDDSTSN